MVSYYYLHTNGSLIHKTLPIDPSDFVKKTWILDNENRATAWNLILESLALDTDKANVKRLIDKWECNLRDLAEYVSRTPNPTDLEIIGVDTYFNYFTNCDANQWFDWLAATPNGEEPDFENMPC